MDDSEAERIIRQHGKLGVLLSADKLSGYPRQFCAWRADGEYFLAGRFSGYPDPADNGFILVILDARTTSPQQAARTFGELMNNGRDWSRPGWELIIEEDESCPR